jgi:hypothetical protein
MRGTNVQTFSYEPNANNFIRFMINKYGQMNGHKYKCNQFIKWTDSSRN